MRRQAEVAQQVEETAAQQLTRRLLAHCMVCWRPCTVVGSCRRAKMLLALALRLCDFDAPAAAALRLGQVAEAADVAVCRDIVLACCDRAARLAATREAAVRGAAVAGGVAFMPA